MRENVFAPFQALIRAGLVILAGASFFYFVHDRAIDCDSAFVKRTVREIIEKNSRWGDSGYLLENIRKIDVGQGGATAFACATKVWVEEGGHPFWNADITYTVEHQADGKILIRVDGIDRLDKWP